MNEKMAERIVEKKLGELGQMLHKKKVEFSADSKAKLKYALSGSKQAFSSIFQCPKQNFIYQQRFNFTLYHPLYFPCTELYANTFFLLL